jgi:hypothetical protein
MYNLSHLVCIDLLAAYTQWTTKLRLGLIQVQGIILPYVHPTHGSQNNKLLRQSENNGRAKDKLLTDNLIS